MIDKLIEGLIQYGLQKRLIEKDDAVWARNNLMSVLGLDSIAYAQTDENPMEPMAVLESILDWAYENGRLASRYAEHSDLLDTRLMGCLAPRPSQVIREFRLRSAEDKKAATDWFYAFNQTINYIRMDRVAKNQSWKVNSSYGVMDITINCSKPEKDPQAIIAAGKALSSDYPACLLCLENVGYAGRLNHPPRQNLRVIPVTLNGEPWYFQYSPYVYYNEHAIIFSEKHIPMAITRETFIRLLDFIDEYPHYFIGSNADLPIVGGSMLSHDHYQGGRYEFAMERASVLGTHVLTSFPQVSCSHLNWPLTVLRLTSSDRGALLEAADSLRRAWLTYSDPEAGILASSSVGRHNTLTPIARRRGADYELDLVLRNNRQSAQYPDGVFHPHSEIHPVKKENIGLIEVMGLAVLPDRLVGELKRLEALMRSSGSLESAALPGDLEKFEYLLRVIAHMDIPEGCLPEEALKRGVGEVFVRGMEHCGVYGTGESGQRGVQRFVSKINEMC